VNAVAFGQVDGRPVVISGSHDTTVRVWDAATGTPVADPFTGHRAMQVRPDSIDLASPTLAVAFDASCRLVVGTELGLVALRFPPPDRLFSPQ
jgi:WD40 repeat protein